MCEKEAETSRHLLHHCEVASKLWSMLFCLSSINWTTTLTVKDAYESWSLWTVDKAIKKIWIMIHACIFWCIWLERNKRWFGGESTALGILKTRCIANLFSWSNLYPAVLMQNNFRILLTHQYWLKQFVQLARDFFVSSNAMSCKSCIFLMLLLIPLIL